MAFLVSLAVVLLAVSTSVLLLLSHQGWLPPAVSLLAKAVDRQFDVTFVISGVLFASAQLLLATFIWKYRSTRRNARVMPMRGHGILQGIWTAAMAVLFVWLAVTGFVPWATARATERIPGALVVEAWGEQFEWHFRYPGPDGKFGPVHPDLMNDGAGNYLGLAPWRDPASRDDIVTANLAVPVNQPVRLILRSKDVIHSFFVRELRIKQDAIPGEEIPVHFTAAKTGTYEIVCTELCGMGHYEMHAKLFVMTEPRFEKWLRKMAAQQ